MWFFLYVKIYRRLSIKSLLWNVNGSDQEILCSLVSGCMCLVYYRTGQQKRNHNRPMAFHLDPDEICYDMIPLIGWHVLYYNNTTTYDNILGDTRVIYTGLYLLYTGQMTRTDSHIFFLNVMVNCYSETDAKH